MWKVSLYLYLFIWSRASKIWFKSGKRVCGKRLGRPPNKTHPQDIMKVLFYDRLTTAQFVATGFRENKVERSRRWGRIPKSGGSGGGRGRTMVNYRWQELKRKMRTALTRRMLIWWRLANAIGVFFFTFFYLISICLSLFDEANKMKFLIIERA